ncbi:hypothetical protein [Streptomyces sp. NPDC058434]|uniref:hypothetical protein n=1 Tax=Streptomyces sp. NPDC058434 TaxID=3346498 RepID=UPI003665F372
MITGNRGSAHHVFDEEWAESRAQAAERHSTAPAVEPAPRGRTGPGLPRHAEARVDVGREERRRRHHLADYIKACVNAVDDADEEFQKDLEAVVKDGGGRNDETAGGFNGNADKVAKADDQLPVWSTPSPAPTKRPCSVGTGGTAVLADLTLS